MKGNRPSINNFYQMSIILLCLFLIPTYSWAIELPFYDNMETGENWNSDTPWGEVTDSFHSESKSWADSPVDGYDNNLDISLTLKDSIDLSNSTNPVLCFWHKHELEHDFDYGYIEISTDNGSNWVSLDAFTGISDWRREQIDLSDYVADTIIIRFRMITDKTVYGDGWYIDDISVSEKPEAVMSFDVSLSNISGNQVDLSWTKSLANNFKEYMIFRSQSSGVTSQDTLVTTITDKNISTYTNQHLNNQTQYYYRIFVVDSFGVYSGSKEVNITTTTSSSIFEDFEHDDTINWQLDAPWTIVTRDDAHSGNRCLADNAQGQYGNNSEKSATFSIDLRTAHRPLLTFYQKYNFQKDVDYGYLDISHDNGKSWLTIFNVTGNQGSEWEKVEISLCRYVKYDQIQLQFRIKTDNDIALSGWLIDDISITDNHTKEEYPFFDSMEDESSADNWIQGKWKKISIDGYSGKNCLTDSPSGNGATYVWSDLYLKGTLDLTNAKNPYISFWHHYHTHNDFRAYVTVSANNGRDWTTEAYWGSTNNSWTNYQVDLSEYAGLSKVSICFATHGHINYDGWYLDDILITDAPVNVLVEEPTEISKHQMKLTWSENTDADFLQYEIYRGEDQNVSRSKTQVAVINDSSTVSFVDQDIPIIGKRYYYRVYVIDTEGLCNQGSNVVSATTSIDEPHQLPFVDDMESGGDQWGNDLPWEVTSEKCHSGSYCWSDSPDGNSQDSMDRSIYKTVNTGNAIRPVLSFWHNYNLEEYEDFGYVEISKDQGSSWQRRFFITGFSGEKWHQVKMDLSEYPDKEIMIRFRIETDGGITYDGWYIDDIKIEENNSHLSFPFSDNMESEESDSNWLMSSWNRVDSDGHDSQHSLNVKDRPYPNLSLSGTIDLSNSSNPYLSFWSRRAEYTPYIYVKASRNNGHDWITLWNGSISNTSWERKNIDCSQFLGAKNLIIHFQQHHDYSGKDGWYLDDVLISDAPVNVRLYELENITEHTMDLSWTENKDDDFVQYEIYRSDSSNVSRSSTQVAIITDQKTLQFADNNIPLAGTTYYYKIFVLDSEGFYNQGSNVVSGTTILNDAHIFPFTDDMESGDQFGNDFPWEVTDETVAHSGSYCWSDSPKTDTNPNGYYENNSDRSLYKVIDLRNAKRPYLSFWHKYYFQEYKDFGLVEISNDNGVDFDSHFFITGSSGTDWEEVNLDLSSQSGKVLIIRFRSITNDDGIVHDGWYIDDISVQENDARTAYPFFDNFESENIRDNWLSSTWNKSHVDVYSGTSCITDSPNRSYVDDTYAHFALRGLIDLTHAIHPELSFWERFSVGHYDYLRVYVSPNGGKDWDNPSSIRGTQSTDWRKRTIDLSQYAGLPDVSIIFRINGDDNYDGWYLDDIRIGESMSYTHYITTSSGDNQIGEAGEELIHPLVATVYNSDSVVNPHIPVIFEITSQGGSLSATRVESDVNGNVKTYLTLPEIPGLVRISATIEGTEQSVAFISKAVYAGLAIKIERVSGNLQSKEIESTLPNPFKVKVTDVLNQPVSGTKVSFTIFSGSGQIAYTEMETSAQGLASTILSYDEIPGQRVIHASVPDLIGSPVTFVSYAFLPGGYIGDLDADGMADDWEQLYNMNPSDPSDAYNDPDGDGLVNAQEFAQGTLPNVSDTDEDEMPDGWEVQYGLDPTDFSDATDDNDLDQILNIDEYKNGSIPIFYQHFHLNNYSDNSITIYGNIDIANIPADIGDEVAAFDPDGTLCGRFTVETTGQYGFMNIYQDDDSTATIDEGAKPKDIITFRIWDASAGVEISADSDTVGTSKPLTWTLNRDIRQVHLYGEGAQEIPLQSGWNLFSFSVKTCYYVSETKPDSPMLPGTFYKKVSSLEDVFSSIKDKYDIVRSFDPVDGICTFDPKLPSFSNIKYVAGGYAYWIRMKEEADLIVNGVRARESDALPLKAGWNLVGYWGTDIQYVVYPTVDFPPDALVHTPVDSINQIFSSIDGQYFILQSFDNSGAHSYDPTLIGFNNFKYIGPGYGLWIKMKTPGNLSYSK